MADKVKVFNLELDFEDDAVSYEGLIQRGAGKEEKIWCSLHDFKKMQASIKKEGNTVYFYFYDYRKDLHVHTVIGSPTTLQKIFELMHEYYEQQYAEDFINLCFEYTEDLDYLEHGTYPSITLMRAATEDQEVDFNMDSRGLLARSIEFVDEGGVGLALVEVLRPTLHLTSHIPIGARGNLFYTTIKVPSPGHTVTSPLRMKVVVPGAEEELIVLYGGSIHGEVIVIRPHSDVPIEDVIAKLENKCYAKKGLPTDAEIIAGKVPLTLHTRVIDPMTDYEA